MRKRAVGDGGPAAFVKRKKDRRPLAVETALLESRLKDLETVIVAQGVRIDLLFRLCEVSDADLKELGYAPSSS